MFTYENDGVDGDGEDNVKRSSSSMSSLVIQNNSSAANDIIADLLSPINNLLHLMRRVKRSG